MEQQLNNNPVDDLQQRIRQIKIQKIKRRHQQLYRYYEPNGKAQKFIEMVGSNRFFINLFIAANGVGKTAVLCNILANIFFPNNPAWFNYPLYQSFPFIPKGRIISDTTTITKTLVPELHKWFPQGKYTSHKADKHYESVWRTKGESGKPNFEFDMMSYEQDVKQFESATLGILIFDEPVPEAIWKASIARLRRGGIIICCFTPLEGSAYFYDNYVVSPQVVRF